MIYRGNNYLYIPMHFEIEICFILSCVSSQITRRKLGEEDLWVTENENCKWSVAGKGWPIKSHDQSGPHMGTLSWEPTVC